MQLHSSNPVSSGRGGHRHVDVASSLRQSPKPDVGSSRRRTVRALRHDTPDEAASDDEDDDAGGDVVSGRPTGGDGAIVAAVKITVRSAAVTHAGGDTTDSDEADADDDDEEGESTSGTSSLTASSNPPSLKQDPTQPPDPQQQDDGNSSDDATTEDDTPPPPPLAEWRVQRPAVSVVMQKPISGCRMVRDDDEGENTGTDEGNNDEEEGDGDGDEAASSHTTTSPPSGTRTPTPVAPPDAPIESNDDTSPLMPLPVIVAPSPRERPLEASSGGTTVLNAAALHAITPTDSARLQASPSGSTYAASSPRVDDLLSPLDGASSDGDTRDGVTPSTEALVRTPAPPMTEMGASSPPSGPRATRRSFRLQLGREVGSGGFGHVRQAINRDNGELVAVKVFKSHLVARDIQREIDVNSKLPLHDHCIAYHGTVSSKHHVCIVMEYVSGGSIEQLLQTAGRFDENTCRQYTRMALSGLRHLHEHDIVHQDIKGANVLVDEKGRAKIADFGCSHDLSTRSGSMSQSGGGWNRGTPLWMSPEVCSGKERASKASDIWSFGCLVLEMLSDNHLPWPDFHRGMNIMTILYAIASAKKPPPFPAVLSDEGKDFLSHCLEIDPSLRWTAAQLSDHPFLRIHAEIPDGGDDEVVEGLSTAVTSASTSLNFAERRSKRRSGDDDGDGDDDDDNATSATIDGVTESQLAQHLQIRCPARMGPMVPPNDATQEGGGRTANPQLQDDDGHDATAAASSSAPPLAVVAPQPTNGVIFCSSAQITVGQPLDTRFVVQDVVGSPSSGGRKPLGQDKGLLGTFKQLFS